MRSVKWTLSVLLAVALAGTSMAEDNLSFGEGSRESSSQIVQRYADVPKGVVLEGTAEGMEPIKSITYDKEKDTFTINGEATYNCPINRKEFAKVLKSLLKDDRMGVTLIQGEPRLYGNISGADKLIDPMVETDKLLGGIIYGIPELLTVKLPGDYKPKVAKERKIPVVAFTVFNSYSFYKNPKDKRYTRAACNIEVQLIPLSDDKTDTGGHLPDEKKLEQYVMEDSDRANLEHLKKFQLEYMKIDFIGQTANIGEAAAFARWIRDSKVDTKDLLEKLK
ncbi:MAG TPA: hypothetical protein VEJ63_07915 [Planctomycetota bacterium]|nr:hypothetical protein [Planctomycetota bacterium]